MEIFEVLKVIVLGIVEGFTEWLPISSTGHMILVEEIIPLHQPEDFKNVFMVVVQLGAILAVLVLYWHKLNPFSRKKKKTQREATLVLWLKIIIACLPAAIVGLPFDDILDAYLMNSYVVAATLILYGVLFIVLENRNANVTFPIQKTSQITFQTALFIGIFQLLSLIPGTSRSGSTILGAMILGCSRGVAAEFSFFLGIPVMFGASLLKLVKFGRMFTAPEVVYLLLGMAVAFIVSLLSIKFLLSYVRKNDFKFFGYYRIVLGVIVLAYFGITALAA